MLQKAPEKRITLPELLAHPLLARYADDVCYFKRHPRNSKAPPGMETAGGEKRPIPNV